MKTTKTQGMFNHLGVAGAFAGLALAATALADDAGQWDHKPMELSSSTFTDGGVLPISMIFESATTSGTNACSVDGSTGGNTSPQLSWRHAPPATRTFAVVMYDTTAAFTHWGIYNIARDTRELPTNAGTPTSSYGQQIEDDFYLGTNGYNGPCPPAEQPYVHHYVFTVYALDKALELPSSTNFPAAAETIYQALIRAGQEGHILASASITGLYSIVPGTD
jgi:Raf kinase inhibitor-like YbhB/YbcL family protein